MTKFVYNLKEEFHKNRNFVFVVFVFCMAAVYSFFATGSMKISEAANLANFQPGNIISDAVMSNYNSMTVTEIQNFLDSKNKCDNRDYNLYLQYTKNQPTITWHWEGEPYNGHFVCLAQERFGDGEEIGQGMTAAEIIYDAAQKNKINPQSLLVLLQKETGLITDKVPNNYDYRKATGYGCPDTAACDSKYYGFKNQVYRAAELFRYVLDNDSRYYPSKKTVFIGYHPSASCGGTKVYIENRATAALYQYTPYQPNAAALNAGYGTGDSCSAYGNRNFYQYFTDWFGSTQISVNGDLVVVPDGEYSIISMVGEARAMALDGSNVELNELDATDDSQRWILRRDKTTGYYEIINKVTNLPVVSQSVEVNQNTNVAAAASATCTRWWKLYQTPENYLTFESTCSSGMVMDVHNGSSAVGTNVEMYFADNTKAQKWQLWTGQTIPDGVYSLATSLNDTKVADIAGGSRNNGANVQIYTSNKTLAQKWIVTYEETTDSYTFINPNTNKALEIASGSLKNGANVQMYTVNTNCAQRWKIHEVATDTYTISSACTASKVLDLSNAQTTNGSNIQIWSYDPNTAAQKWQLIAAPEIADGIYTIASKVSSSGYKVIDLSNGSALNGANIQLWSYDSNTMAQKWNITRDAETGYYSIINPKTEKSLDIFAADIRNGINIHQYGLHNGCTQKWRIIENAPDAFTILTSCNTNYALDVSGGKNANGTNIQLWSYDGNAAAQRWSFISRD